MLSIALKKCKSNYNDVSITSHRSEWPSSINLQAINSGQSVEKGEPSYIVGRKVNWYSHYGEQYGGFFKN